MQIIANFRTCHPRTVRVGFWSHTQKHKTQFFSAKFYCFVAGELLLKEQYTFLAVSRFYRTPAEQRRHKTKQAKRRAVELEPCTFFYSLCRKVFVVISSACQMFYMWFLTNWLLGISIMTAFQSPVGRGQISYCWQQVCARVRLPLNTDFADEWIFFFRDEVQTRCSELVCSWPLASAFACQQAHRYARLLCLCSCCLRSTQSGII